MNFVSRETSRAAPRPDGAAPAVLREVDGFGANPGDLRMLVFEPRRRSRPSPAVVVLHGCNQTAAGFDAASGWSRLAEAHGFVLIYPEQKRGNNDRGCFSWFQPADVARGTGEAESVRQMVDWSVGTLGVDAGGEERWPAVSIWYGTGDKVVKPINAGELVKQWTNVHGVGAMAPEVDRVGPAERRVWRDGGGCRRVASYMVPGLGHGVPVDDADPPAPYFLPAGLSATRRIADDFGLLDRRATRRRPPAKPAG